MTRGTTPNVSLQLLRFPAGPKSGDDIGDFLVPTSVSSGTSPENNSVLDWPSRDKEVVARKPLHIGDAGELTAHLDMARRDFQSLPHVLDLLVGQETSEPLLVDIACIENVVDGEAGVVEGQRLGEVGANRAHVFMAAPPAAAGIRGASCQARFEDELIGQSGSNVEFLTLSIDIPQLEVGERGRAGKMAKHQLQKVCVLPKHRCPDVDELDVGVLVVNDILLGVKKAVEVPHGVIAVILANGHIHLPDVGESGHLHPPHVLERTK